MSLKNLAVYWHSGERAKKGFDPSKDMVTDDGLVLRPVCGELKLRLRKGTSRIEPDVPATALDFLFESLGIVLEETQLHQFRSFFHFVANHSALVKVTVIASISPFVELTSVFLQYRKLRPAVSIKENPAAWWLFACEFD